jgi:hypothetical protein
MWQNSIQKSATTIQSEKTKPDGADLQSVQNYIECNIRGLEVRARGSLVTKSARSGT